MSKLSKAIEIVRHCIKCGYEWDSMTAFRGVHTTKCPKCGELVPGDSYYKKGGTYKPKDPVQRTFT